MLEHEPPYDFAAGRERLREALARDGGFNGLRRQLSHSSPQETAAIMGRYGGLLLRAIRPDNEADHLADTGNDHQSYEEQLSREVAVLQQTNQMTYLEAASTMAAFHLLKIAYPGIEFSDVMPGM